MKTKHCSRCHNLKRLVSFSRCARTLDGYQGECKECRHARYRQYHPLPALGSLCGQFVQRGIMTESRPCIQPAGHKGALHTPDLTGLQFYSLQVLGRGLQHITPNGTRRYTWNCIDAQGRHHFNIYAQSLIDGRTTGVRAPKGTGHTTRRDGYRIIRKNGKQVLEHRVIMAKLLGRPLRHDEQVHHGPKGRACNDSDNLSIRLVGKHPAGHEERELADWLRSLGWRVNPPKRLRLLEPHSSS